MNSYSRVMIFGRPGSGKSTFALNLHKMTTLPLHHLDKYFYEKDWKERSYPEFLNIQQKIVDADKWIVDGNNTKSLEMRYQRSDLVLYFNFPRLRCVYRILKRRFYEKPNVDDRALGCNEVITSKLFHYMWNFHQRVLPVLRVCREFYPQTPFFEIQNDTMAQNLLLKIKEA